MNLHSLLTNLANQGVKLSTQGNSLEVDAPQGVITEELHNSLLLYKAEILKLLQNTKSTSLPAVVPAPESRYEPFPLTDMQHAFWVGRSGILELGNVSNHGYYEIEGNDLNPERLNQALQKLIKRHDMLRAVVLADGQQQVLEQVPAYQMQVLDLREKDQETTKKELTAIRDRLSHQVLPSNKWPLFDFRLTLLEKGRARLHISYDLQVFDAWSLFRLFDEWFQLYQNPQLELKPLEITFRDYVLTEQAWQNTEQYKRSQEYWFNRLDSLPPAPDLPLAKSPKQLKQHRCQRYEGRLDQNNWQKLKEKAAQIGLTPSGVLLAAFAEIITFWSKEPQFINRLLAKVGQEDSV
ncbi:hypothetical protein IQ238_21775 [Pleurocapsales cyanobacterium LEGE 06147]|nr:hypothetical protein [Pleurocapsales cyanobacterium LEGE 06147]